MTTMKEISILLVLPILLMACTQTTQGPETDLVITGATLIDGSGAAPQSGVTIHIRDGRITGIINADEAVIPDEAEVIEAAGKYVIPGLADMHVHFSLGAPLPRRPGTTDAVLARKLYYGVTSILALGTSDAWTESIRELRARRSAGELQAPYIYGTGGHLTLQGTHPIYTIFPPAVREAADSLAAETPMSEPVNLYSLGIGLSFVRTHEAARKAVRERAAGGMDAIKITVESGPTPFGDDHPQMPVEMIRAIVDEATLYGMPVLAHVTSLDELEATLEGGAAGVVHAVRDDPLPDGTHADEMAASGFSMIPTLVLFAEPGGFDDPFLREAVSDEEIAALEDPDFIERRRQRWECCAAFDDLLANMGMLHERGIPIAVGTDTGNPYVFPGYSVHQEMELLAQAGLSAMEVIRAATQRAAQSIGKDDEFGTIEPGKRADLLILGKNPLEDIRHSRSLEVVVSEGRIVDRKKLLEQTSERDVSSYTDGYRNEWATEGLSRAAAAEERVQERRSTQWLAKQGESSAQFRNEKKTDHSGDDGCLTKTALSNRLQFASIDRAREILGRSDEWARQLSAFDRGVRMRTTEPTNTRDFLEFISGAATAWTDDEQPYWQSLIDQLGEALEGMNLNIPDAWMVKTTGLEEFNAVYVRNQAIILPQRRIDIAGDVRRDFFLLAHELFHLLSLENPSWRDELYALIGFRRFSGFEYPAELEGRRLSNPMYGARHEYALTVQTASGPVDVTPVYQAAVSLEEFIRISMGHPRELFEAIDFVLLPVDTGTRTVLRDDSGNPIIYHFGDTDWIERMQRNSSYIIHPDELMAENFALLMEWRRSGTVPESVPGGPGAGFPINDIELLTEFKRVLTAGCEQ